MNQIKRKNKTNQVVEWPTSTYFSIQELLELNPKFKEITLRVRLANQITEGKIAEIGFVPGGKGRPPKVFSFTPVTPDVLNKAESNKISLVDRAREKFVNVVSVNTSSNSVSPLPTSNKVTAAI